MQLFFFIYYFLFLTLLMMIIIIAIMIIIMMRKSKIKTIYNEKVDGKKRVIRLRVAIVTTSQGFFFHMPRLVHFMSHTMDL